MKSIVLRGRYAFGAHACALVDDEDFSFLNSWKWKAKPNGGNNNTYAVRNTMVGGRWVTIRMHREILGLSSADDCDVDHIDHNSLNNQKDNLRRVTRRINVLNMKAHRISYTCKGCSQTISESVRLATKDKKYCSRQCRAMDVKAPRSSVLFMRCMECGEAFVGRTAKRQFCSDACRCVAKRRRVSYFLGSSQRLSNADEKTAKTR